MTATGDQVRAVFQPARRSDLVFDATRWIGRCSRWCAMWLIEDGAYVGQCAWMPLDSEPPPFAWVPDEDLVVVTDDRDDVEAWAEQARSAS